MAVEAVNLSTIACLVVDGASLINFCDLVFAVHDAANFIVIADGGVVW